jgi:hypothetical protein
LLLLMLMLMLMLQEILKPNKSAADAGAANKHSWCVAISGRLLMRCTGQCMDRQTLSGTLVAEHAVAIAWGSAAEGQHQLLQTPFFCVSDTRLARL